MARPKIGRGDYGKVSSAEVDGRWRAWARYVPTEGGDPRLVQRYALTKTKAESAVRKALDERNEQSQANPTASLRRSSTVADAWADYEREVLADRAESSQRLYRLVWAKHVGPAMGKLTVAEVTEADAERLVNRVARDSGAGAAKVTRTVLLGVMERARKSRAIRVNPVKGSDRPTAARKVETKRDKDRALTTDERAGLLALEGDTADLIALMLGTGARLGEACAVRWEALDLDAGTVHIGATVARNAAGRSVWKDQTKTEAGDRTVAMPKWLTERLTARKTWTGAEQRANKRTGRVARAAVDPAYVFPAPRDGGVRDLRATDREIRRVLDAQELEWATSHTFRRTAVTMLLSGGMDPVQVAKVVGHSRPSLTLDVYGKADTQVQARSADIL